LRSRCIELLTEIEARLDFEDEMPLLDPVMLVSKINCMRQEVQDALDTSSYDKLLQSGLQVFYSSYTLVILKYILLLKNNIVKVQEMHLNYFADSNNWPPKCWQVQPP
jgi:hypothetical protein